MLRMLCIHTGEGEGRIHLECWEFSKQWCQFCLSIQPPQWPTANNSPHQWCQFVERRLEDGQLFVMLRMLCIHTGEGEGRIHLECWEFSKQWCQFCLSIQPPQWPTANNSPHQWCQFVERRLEDYMFMDVAVQLLFHSAHGGTEG